MSAVTDVGDRIAAAVRVVRSLRVSIDLGANLAPPAVLIGVPTLRWETPSSEPSSVSYPLYLVVAADSSSSARLLALVPELVAAVDTVPDAAVISAVPGVFLMGGTDLPAYTLTVDCAVG